MKHVHHDMIVEWAADPSRVVQRYYGAGVWFDERSPQWYPNDKYRFKPESPKKMDKSISLRVQLMEAHIRSRRGK